MPTEQSTQGADGQSTPPAPQEGQNAQAHSEQSSFDARKAFDATNKRVNDMASKLESFDPSVIAQIADKLGITKKEAEKQVDQNPNVQDVARQIAREELWNSQNADRFSKANKDGAYDAYLKQGIKPDLALRLAEQDSGIQVDTSGQKRQQQVSAQEASVDRSGGAPGNYNVGSYGITQPDVEKYGQLASQIRIIR